MCVCKRERERERERVEIFIKFENIVLQSHRLSKSSYSQRENFERVENFSKTYVALL